MRQRSGIIKYLDILTTTCKCDDPKLFFIGCLVGAIMAVFVLFIICSLLVNKEY